jgi:hypothetical protein
MWANGWSVHYNPEIRVAHEHRAHSDKHLLSQHSLWHYRSMLHYLLKYGRKGFVRPSPKCSSRTASNLPSEFRQKWWL